MTTTHTIEPGAGLPDDELPGYWRMLHAYHRSRSAELRAMIATLPLAPGDRVLDVASGDGCHSVWLVEQGDANALAFADGMFDLVWCAQSFYSLPDPIATLREMVRVTRPGGHVAVLEN